MAPGIYTKHDIFGGYSELLFIKLKLYIKKKTIYFIQLYFYHFSLRFYLFKNLAMRKKNNSVQFESI